MFNFDYHMKKDNDGKVHTDFNLKPKVTIRPYGFFAAAFVSYFSGDSILWIILHTIFGWFYVIYKLAWKFFAN